MNTEGKTPSRTPATTTKSMHFFVGEDVSGNVSYGDESYPVYAGVVECPLEMAAGPGWPAASQEQVAAFKKDADKAAKDAAKEAEAKAKAEAEAAAKAATKEAEAKAKAEAEAAAKAAEDAAKAAKP